MMEVKGMATRAVSKIIMKKRIRSWMSIDM